jgi:hypothetical protein
MIPASKLDLHEGYCLRNIKKCDKCSEMIDINDKATHEEEFHKSVDCPMCRKQMEASALESHKLSCPSRKEPCAFCSLEFGIRDINEHREHCGSRTANCELCNKICKLREMEAHVRRCPEEQVELRKNREREKREAELRAANEMKQREENARLEEAKKYEERKARDLMKAEKARQEKQQAAEEEARRKKMEQQNGLRVEREREMMRKEREEAERLERERARAKEAEKNSHKYGRPVDGERNQGPGGNGSRNEENTRGKNHPVEETRKPREEAGPKYDRPILNTKPGNQPEMRSPHHDLLRHKEVKNQNTGVRAEERKPSHNQPTTTLNTGKATNPISTAVYRPNSRHEDNYRIEPRPQSRNEGQGKKVRENYPAPYVPIKIEEPKKTVTRSEFMPTGVYPQPTTSKGTQGIAARQPEKRKTGFENVGKEILRPSSSYNEDSEAYAKMLQEQFDRELALEYQNKGGSQDDEKLARQMQEKLDRELQEQYQGNQPPYRPASRHAPYDDVYHEFNDLIDNRAPLSRPKAGNGGSSNNNKNRPETNHEIFGNEGHDYDEEMDPDLQMILEESRKQTYKRNR